MSEKHYPYYGGDFDRIIFDRDGSVWVPEAKLRDVESENASLRGAVQGLGELCDGYKTDNDRLRELILDMLVDEERGHNDDDTYYEHVRLANGLGIEVRSRWSALTGTRGARTTATR